MLQLAKNPAVALAAALTAIAAAYVEVNKGSDETKRNLLTLLGTQEKVNDAMEYAARTATLLGTEVNETAQAWVDFDNGLKALRDINKRFKNTI